jgi:hypothetical protein
MLRTTVLVGLGEFGAGMVPRLAEWISTRDPVQGGLVTHVTTAQPPPVDAEPEDPPVHGSAVPGDAMRQRAARAGALQAAMADLILGAVSRVRDHAAGAALERRGHVVADEMVIEVVAGLSEAAATAALPLVLAATHGLFESALLDMPAEIHLTLVMPDLLHEAPAPCDQARAYAALQEIEATFALNPHLCVDTAWIFSRRNDADRFAGPAEGLHAVLCEHTWSVVRATPPSRAGARPASRARGPATRYCTFGCAVLRFPRAELIAGLADAAAAQAFRTLPELGDRRYPADSIYSVVGDFVSEQQLAWLPERLAASDGGAPLLPTPFLPPVAQSPGDDLVNRLALYSAGYEPHEREFQRALVGRSEALKQRMRSGLLGTVAAMTQAGEQRGTLGAAHAWLSVAIGETSNFVEGAAGLPGGGTIRGALDTLEDRLYLLLFGSDRDEALTAYVQNNPGAPRSRRELLRYMKSVVEQRTRLRHQLRADVGRLSAEAEALGERAAHRAVHGSANPVAAATAELDEQSARERLEAAQAALEGLEAPFAAARAALASVRAEVERLDRALRDDVVRWEKFREEESRAAAAISEAQSTYATAEQTLGAASDARNAASQRTRLWRVCIVAAAFVGQSIWLSSNWRIAAAVSFVVVLGAAGAWLRAGRGLKEAREAFDEAMGTWRGAGKALVGAWCALADLRFQHLVFSHVADWCRWLPELVRSHRGAVERLAGDLGRHSREAAERGARWEPAPSPHVENVAPEGGLDGVLQARAGQLAGRTADFWRGEGRSFAARVQDVLSRHLTAPELFEAMRASLADVFADLRTLSVERFLEVHVPTPAARWKLVDRVHRAAAPFGKRVFRSPDLHADEVTYAALSENSVNSPIRDALLQMRRSPTVFYGGTQPTEVVVSRVVVDLEPYQIAAVHESARQLDGLSEDARREVYSDPEIHAHLPPLVHRSVFQVIRAAGDPAGVP